MAGIFISYRRDDSAGYTGRLLDDMKDAFGQQQIFRDIEAIEAGADFYETIDAAVASCSVLLAVVGPRWLSAANAKGERRLDHPNDFVRIEIAAALKRNIKVIPVLVGGATMPPVEELPDDLKALARRNALEMTDRRWDYDVHELFIALDKVPGLVRLKQPANVAAPPPPPKRGMSTGLKLFFAVIGVVAVLVIYGVTQEANQPDRLDLSQPPANLTAAAPRVDSPASAPPAAVAATPIAPAQSAPAVSPATAPANVPVQPAAAPANLSGNWRTSDGDAFYIEQSGGELAVLAADATTQHGFMGQGVVRGQQVELALRHLQSGVMMSMQMNVSADGRQMSGVAREHVTGSSQNIMLTRY